MDKHAFLVLGPESTGTRLWTLILISCGCYGDGGHGQRIDKVGIPESEPWIVWRRSLPHAGRWPNIREMAQKLRDARYEVQALMCVRDWRATLRSQLLQMHADTLARAEENLQIAYPYAFLGLKASKVPFVLASYESLTQYGPDMFAPLLERLGLTVTPTVCKRWAPKLYDGNRKHYDGGGW